MKASDIRALNDEELAKKLGDLKHEHFNLRFQHEIGQLEDTTLLKKIKRDVARVNTIIRERELKN